MPDGDRVLDDEILYRRVPDREENYERDNGSYNLLPAAFLDRAKQPSVDRAILRGNDPTECRWEPTDLVVSMITVEVRRIDDISRTVDVVPDPIKDHLQLPDNPAHALITADPQFQRNEKTAFRKLRIALSRLSSCKWEISPG